MACIINTQASQESCRYLAHGRDLRFPYNAVRCGHVFFSDFSRWDTIPPVSWPQKATCVTAHTQTRAVVLRCACAMKKRCSHKQHQTNPHHTNRPHPNKRHVPSISHSTCLVWSCTTHCTILLFQHQSHTQQTDLPTHCLPRPSTGSS